MSDTSISENEKDQGPKNPKKVQPWEEAEKHTKTRSVSNSFFTNQARWTYPQKSHLLKLLKLCTSENDVPKVYHNIPDHTPEEVEEEVNRLRIAASLNCSRGPSLQAPIETWLDFCEELINFEEEDNSKCLGRAMSIVANYEQFKKEKNKPNYKNLYKYMAAILNGVEPPKLSPLDSLVVVDLMHSLVDVLSETDTFKQRAVMKWKFSLLNCKVNINNMRETQAQTHKALGNIFPEDLFTSGPQTAGTIETVIVEPPKVINNTSRSSVQETKNASESNDEHNDSNQTGDLAIQESHSRSRAPGETTPNQDAGEGCHALEPNSKRKYSNQTGISNQTGDQALPSTSSAQGGITPNQDGGQGRQASQLNDKDCDRNDDLLEMNSEHNSNQNGEQSEHDEPPSKKMCVKGHGKGRGRGRRVRGHGRRDHGVVPLEKPQLYTLNPFCVPVDILKLPKGKTKDSL